ncbi:hypothetical protein ACHOLT_09815 [Desulfitobacterium sp. Sab5]|uniref:hypothetical protein n=1 Tax=Desulfitobacterium nosdiversum TaxID=3375356 RepID=UPI003CF7A850
MSGIPMDNLKYLSLIAAAFLSIGSAVWSVQGKIHQLNGEKQYWQVQAEQIPSEAMKINLPGLLDLPTLIEECQDEFKEQAVQVVYANLDRIGEENNKSTGQSSGLNYALFHFKLKGSWSGIEAALNQIENSTNKSIQLQEVRLNSESGDVALKIYFYEPDKPL